MTLTPAYGRDYKSKKEVQADLDAGKDFLVADLFSGGGGYINKPQILESGVRQVTVRYGQLRKVTVLQVKPQVKP